MPGQRVLQLHRSNRMEVLASGLATLMKSDPLLPTQEEWVVVPGDAMQRWLSIRLSDACGVVANVRFPFPQHLVDQALRSVLPSEESPGEDQRRSIYWSVAAQLANRAADKGFDEVQRYLQRGDGHFPSARKRFQLAEQVARLFERYMVYRPELVEGWGAGQEEGWQPELWRGLGPNVLDTHPGARLKEYLSAVQQGEGAFSHIPRRIFLFGISALPPLFTRMISALASRVEVHAFVLSPSRQYWADIRRGNTLVNEDADAAADGNPLLSSLGRLAGDFQQVLEDNAEYSESGDELYVEPVASDMLSVLQSDILDLQHRKSLSDRAAVNSDDRSVSIHSCHSPMREMEVLHDQLVSRFEMDPGLNAGDVVVMAPDIELYAPSIEAVFSSSRRDRPTIEYSVADRSQGSVSHLIRAYTLLLETLGGRLPVSGVRDLLEHECIRERFGLSEEDLPLLSKWVVESGIRWGADENHRAELGQPALKENTWRFGLDRLLLGYAFPHQDGAIFEGVAGYSDMEGTQLEELGKFVSFCECLFNARDTLGKSELLPDRIEWLLSLLDDMISSSEENLLEHQEIRDTISELSADANAAGFSGEIPYETITGLLQKRWQKSSSARGFLNRGVTFCQLTPMRSIPFRVVCVVGLNDGVFPRTSGTMEFDRMAAKPRLGDRQARDDDRYLFLEALLAARDCFWLSYVGQSIKNNSEVCPSVIVGEFIDVVKASFVAPDTEILDQVITKHPLQPFSPDYFSSESKLFSYSKAYCEGARSLGHSRKNSASRFFARALAESSDNCPEIQLADLVSYFQKPTAFLMERRLGVYLRDYEVERLDREPIMMGGLEVWKVADEVLQVLVRQGENCNAENLYASMRAQGRIPLGMVGTCWYQALSEVLDKLMSRAQQHMESGNRDNLEVDLVLKNSRIRGSVDSLWGNGRLVLSYSALGNVTEIGHWIKHLVLSALEPDDIRVESLMIGRPKSGQAEFATYQKVESPLTIIESLVELYLAGQRLPIPLFPVAGRKFVHGLKGEPFDLALPDFGNPHFAKSIQTAKNSYGGKTFPAESLDPYHQQVFADDNCLDRHYRPNVESECRYWDFSESSAILFGPMLEHRQGAAK